PATMRLSSTRHMASRDWLDLRARDRAVALTLPAGVWHNGNPSWSGKNIRGSRRRNRNDMKNGLYSIHVSLQDGRSGKGSGVVMFRDGKILGGDAYLFYIGTYTAKGDTFKGEV